MAHTLLAEGQPPFEDCLHKDWTLGCERCFWEATNVAKGNIKADTQQGSIEQQTEGAILFAWHAVMVLQDLGDQCLRSANTELDIGKIGLCRDLAANMQQIAQHFIKTISDPRALAAAMQRAVLICMEMQRRHEQGPGSAPAESIIKLTDVA